MCGSNKNYEIKPSAHYVYYRCFGFTGSRNKKTSGREARRPQRTILGCQRMSNCICGTKQPNYTSWDFVVGFITGEGKISAMKNIHCVYFTYSDYLFETL